MGCQAAVPKVAHDNACSTAMNNRIEPRTMATGCQPATNVMPLIALPCRTSRCNLRQPTHGRRDYPTIRTPKLLCLGVFVGRLQWKSVSVSPRILPKQ